LIQSTGAFFGHDHRIRTGHDQLANRCIRTTNGKRQHDVVMLGATASDDKTDRPTDRTTKEQVSTYRSTARCKAVTPESSRTLINFLNAYANPPSPSLLDDEEVDATVVRLDDAAAAAATAALIAFDGCCRSCEAAADSRALRIWSKDSTPAAEPVVTSQHQGSQSQP
jgi:hypothetical protein